MSVPFEVGKTYNFDVYPSQILGNAFTNMTVVGVFDSTMAAQSVDINAMHAQVKAYVSGIPSSPSGYVWVKFRDSSGSFSFFGLPWINEDTIELVESKTMQVTIKGVSASDINKVKAALTQNGFTNLSVEMLNINS